MRWVDISRRVVAIARRRPHLFSFVSIQSCSTTLQYMPNIEDNLAQVRNRVQLAAEKARRPADAVRLLAVSKTKPAEALRHAHAAGQRSFGENYLQEALDKQQQLVDLDIEWHFIGPIQSNKTRPIARAFDWVHSVDRLKIARRLSEQREGQHPPLNICLQVNLDNEDSKAGVTLEELPELAQTVAALPNISLRGLMAIPAPREEFAQQYTSLARLQQALQHLQQLPGLAHLDTLSMGMSRDLEAAICAGATIVRVGTDIFGARPAPGNQAPG